MASGLGFHDGEVGVEYAPFALKATGGVQPYRWSVALGGLPPGVNLGSDGNVSGNPTSAGQYAFRIEVDDAGDSKATIPGSINIAPRLSAILIPPCATSCNVELGCALACGVFGQLSGGVAPYTFTVKQGTLPAGTSLSTSTLSLTGTFTGLPGYLQFTVQVADAFGVTATLSPKFWMYPHVSVASGGCSVNYGSACTTRLQISGGVPNDHFTVLLVRNDPPGARQGCGSPGPPPPGSLTVSGSSVVINVPGIWPNSSGYGAVWTIRVVDSALCAPESYCGSNDATVVVEVQCG